MTKTFPQNWGTRHVAYFAGQLSKHVSVNNLIEMVDESIASNPNRFLLFADLVERIEPHLSAAQWTECVDHCEKIFARQQEETHAK